MYWITTYSPHNIFLYLRSNHRRCSVSKGVLKNFAEWILQNSAKILQNSQVFSCEFCEFFHNSFSYRTPPGDCFWILLPLQQLFTNCFSTQHLFLENSKKFKRPWFLRWFRIVFIDSLHLLSCKKKLSPAVQHQD